MATVEAKISDKQLEEIKEYALYKWRGSIASLLRHSLHQYMDRYPYKPKGCTAQAILNEVPELRAMIKTLIKELKDE